MSSSQQPSNNSNNNNSDYHNQLLDYETDESLYINKNLFISINYFFYFILDLNNNNNKYQVIYLIIEINRKF
jgi:hypothetical protein